MEEYIGKVWDRFLTKRSRVAHESERVFFNDKRKSLKLFYHLMGGEKGKALGVTDKRFVKTRRTLLEKISGEGRHFFLAWQDEKGLYLPASIACFADKKENEMLYYWLVAMAAKTRVSHADFEVQNMMTTRRLLDVYAGFSLFYEQSKARLEALCPSHPNFMWIYPPLGKNALADEEVEEEARNATQPQQSERLQMKKRAQQIDDKKESDGMLVFLPDSILSIMEQVNVDRSEDDSFDENALYNAEDLDEITLGRKKANLSARIKMELDINTHSGEMYPLGKGHFIDEWDYKTQRYLENYVCIKPLIATDVVPMALPKRLHKMVRKIQGELDLMELDRIRRNNLPYGDEINIDTWIDYRGHRNKSGHAQRFYESFERKTRDMSTLILADISLSTEAGITQEIRIIDMIKEALMVFSESLERLRDRFAIYAFSSLKNTNVRFHIIKNFKEKYTDQVRGRIDAIKPGYYTRLGAAIRNAATILHNRQSADKLLLIISDGKPNDVDRYDGRYGIEDTKKAIDEVRKLGITPFCITIDLEAKAYLAHLFGKNGYVVVRDSRKLSKVLPEIYLNLTK